MSVDDRCGIPPSFLGEVSFEVLHLPRQGLEEVCFTEKMEIIFLYIYRIYIFFHIYVWKGKGALCSKDIFFPVMFVEGRMPRLRQKTCLKTRRERQ